MEIGWTVRSPCGSPRHGDHGTLPWQRLAGSELSVQEGNSENASTSLSTECSSPPFLRCIQTAFEVISALCAVQDNYSEMTSENVPIDPSKLKVSIEYGLCEVLSGEAISPNFAPTDGNWDFNISKLEERLPAGTVDHSAERVYQELPKWEEPLMDVRARYKLLIYVLADKYPCEN